MRDSLIQDKQHHLENEILKQLTTLAVTYINTLEMQHWKFTYQWNLPKRYIT